MDDIGFHLVFPPDFPLHDLQKISRRLAKADICVPGYLPPEVGLYDIRGYFYESHSSGVQVILLPDRNIASRFAQLAQGKVIPNEAQRKGSAALLAFAQCLDILIEPGIAFHELAHQQGNEAAQDELGWFRAADNSRPHDVMDVALGRKNKLSERYHPAKTEHRNLAAPLHRWNRNYIIGLKILELEQNLVKPIDRVLSLLRWMEEDFIFAGPAALLASVYFAPRSPPKGGVFKGKNSPDRERAIAGARNQAWDLTQLSDFVRLVRELEDGKTRYLFASFDEHLRLMAKLLFGFTETDVGGDALLGALSLWWPLTEAKLIVAAIDGHINRVQSPEWSAKEEPFPDFISTMIAQGEQRVRDSAPR